MFYNSLTKVHRIERTNIITNSILMYFNISMNNMQSYIRLFILKVWNVFFYYIYAITVCLFQTRHHKFDPSYNWTDIILYFDMVLMSYVAYYDQRSLLITHPLLTLSRYLKHAFLLDLISVFPFEQLVNIIRSIL